MNYYYEFKEPYYALIKAKSGEDAVSKYIEEVAGDDKEFVLLMEIANPVPEFYASARFARVENENGELIDMKELVEIFESDEAVVLIIDGSLI